VEEDGKDPQDSDTDALNADKETVTLSSEDVAARPDDSASRLIGGREQDSTSAPLGFRMATLSGKTIGNYQIENELGRGAMGVVYRAKQLSMDRYVALKFLPKRLAQDDRILQRFNREARAAGQLSHPHIVSVHDVGVLEGFHYIAMELVDGNSVQSHIKERGPYPEKEALEIARQIAEALKYAHNRGILHRDIKPDNFLIDSHGRVRLADLGLARVTNPDSSKEADLTQDGTALGTPHYMSPEQCKGEPVDARSDIYGLGAALFVLVSNHTPYEAATAAAVMVKVLTEHPKSLKKFCPHLTPGFLALVEKMMAKDAAKRFPDAQHVVEAIEKVKNGTYKVPATSHHAKVPAHPPLAKTPRLKLMLMGAGAAVVALVVLGILAGRRNNEAAQKPENGGAGSTALIDPKTLETNAQGTPAQANPVVPAVEIGKAAAKETAPAVAAKKDDDEHEPQRMEARKHWRELEVELNGKYRRDPAAAVQRIEEFMRNFPRAKLFVGTTLERLREADAKLKKDYVESRAQSEAAMKANNKQLAFETFLKFVATHEGTPQSEEWIREVRSMYVSEMRKEAERQLKAGEFDKADSLLTSVLKAAPREQSAAIQQELDTVRAAQKAAVAERDADEKRITELYERARNAVLEAEVPSGKRYDVAKAIALVNEELGRFKTEAARKTAEALGSVYVRAADVFRRMKATVNAKSDIELASLGNFKTACIVQKWDEASLHFKTGNLPQQSLALKNVLPENVLELAKKLSIGTGATSDDQFDLGSLAFAIGQDAVATQAFDKVTANKTLQPGVAAAQRFLKGDATVIAPVGDREQASQKMYDELVAARARKDQGAVLQLSTRLIVDFADTQFVKSRQVQIQQLTVPGSDPVEAAAVPVPATAATAGNEELAVAEMKKLGFNTVDGDWQFDKTKAFSTQTSGFAEAELKDGAIMLSYQLDEGATLELYVREDGNSPESVKERARIEAYNVEIGEGYGIHASKAGIVIYGDKSTGMTATGTSRGSMERTAIPIRVQTLGYQPVTHSAMIQVHGDELIITSDDRTFKTREKLRDGGFIVLRVTGRAKIGALKLGK